MCREITADYLVYQDIEALKQAIADVNPALTNFEASCFDGVYVTGDVSQEYLDRLEYARHTSKGGSARRYAAFPAEPEPRYYRGLMLSPAIAGTSGSTRRGSARQWCAFRIRRTDPNTCLGLSGKTSIWNFHHDHQKKLRLHYHHPAQRPPQGHRTRLASQARAHFRCLWLRR